MKNNLEEIPFYKLKTDKFSEQDKKDLVKELKKRNISLREKSNCIYFDERYIKEVKDIIPRSLR